MSFYVILLSSRLIMSEDSDIRDRESIVYLLNMILFVNHTNFEQQREKTLLDRFFQATCKKASRAGVLNSGSSDQ